ncbi:MAG: aldehyde dehydrogenase family protein [Pseudoclavibacter sp.]
MSIATVNPTTGAVEKSFDEIDDAELERRLQVAHDAWLAHRKTTFAERSAFLLKAADLLDADAETLGRTITVEMGKPLAQAVGEVHKSAKALRFYAEKAEGFLAPEPLDDPSIVDARQAFSVFQPIGPVLAVMPWNYPVWQVIRFAAPAIMAGNVGLLKHASNVPQTAVYLEELFLRAGLPEGVFQTLLIGARRVEKVIRDTRVAAVTLTGSEPAGRSVASIASDEVKKSVLELGGSDPFVVMPSADLDQAVATAVTARVSNNGQACINAKRFIVHADVYHEFLEKFVDAFSKLRLGDPLDAATDIGPVSTEQGREDLVELIEDAKANGASVLVGGSVPEGDGWFVEPTVIANLTPKARLFYEEAFGPVASVYKVSNLDEAIDLANDTPFGLGSAAWTNDEAEQQRFIAELDAGSVVINSSTISYQELPFGGTKRSGYGRELAAEGIREFTNLKSVRVC